MTDSAIGEVQVSTWNFRACVIDGCQQIYVAVLWFWGSPLTEFPLSGINESTSVIHHSFFTQMAVPVAIFMWTIGLVTYIGLPDYYRQAPKKSGPLYRFISQNKTVLVSMNSTRMHF